jgi:Tol biopolymer transport system component
MDTPRVENCINRVAFQVALGAPNGLFRSIRSGLGGLLAAGLSACLLVVHPAIAIDLASINNSGAPGNSSSNGVATNSDGSIVVFYSNANNLVPGDTNQVRDVFLRNVNAGTTERVSLSNSGEQANGPSHATGSSPAVSADGQVVAFYSDATNLVADDTNHQSDVFVRLRDSGATERVSVATDGTEGNGPSVNPSMSEDGRFVAFQSRASNLVANDTNDTADIFVRDRQLNTTVRVCDNPQPNRYSFSPSISADGRFVAFASAATNLVPDDTNGAIDVFRCEISTGIIEPVSVVQGTTSVLGNGDSILPAISGNGLVVGFKSLATNLVPNDTNGVVDVFVRDFASTTTERISVNIVGGNANDFSFPPTLNADGRFVGFGSYATNLVVGDTNTTSDVFVRDRQIGFTKQADVNAKGEEANQGSPDVVPALSSDGKQIGFVSFATNLVPVDTNQVSSVFAAVNPFFGPGMCPDGTCPDGQVCVQGSCVTPTPTRTATRTPPPPATATATKTPTPTATFMPCTTDDQCPPGKHCRTGFCKIERPCDDTDPVVDRHECRVREACINNLCECGGDCNLDGYVLVNEINRAIKILGGAPLSQCPAANIDGNDSVMANEVMLAVINLGEGCVQEGQPLIFAHDRGGMVTFTVGSVSGSPGQDASVTIGMSGGGGELAAGQLDLLFDPTVLDVGDPSAACTKDPRLTQDVLVVTMPDEAAPDGKRRLRLFVGDVTAPIATFTDGTIATCTFHIRSEAAAAPVTLAADRLNVSDARGNVFGSQAVSGGVSILLAAPTPVPAPTPGAACPGDCDGDGEVFVNEVTMAVRILAGEVPLSECPAADADGDGEVFVTDVTRAALSLGHGCPQ